MFGVSPKLLTDEELIRYSRLYGPDALTTEWVAELLKRLEQRVYAHRPSQD